jgi:hypothetical protein
VRGGGGAFRGLHTGSLCQGSPCLPALTQTKPTARMPPSVCQAHGSMDGFPNVSSPPVHPPHRNPVARQRRLHVLHTAVSDRRSSDWRLSPRECELSFGGNSNVVREGYTGKNCLHRGAIFNPLPPSHPPSPVTGVVDHLTGPIRERRGGAAANRAS